MAALSLWLLAGCSSTPINSYSSVLAGMSRNNLRFYFGEPSRIEPNAAGGENWYYSFTSWKVKPTAESGTREDFGEKSSYVSVGLSGSEVTEEHAVHVAADGFVVGPVPTGKVVKH